MPRTLVGALGQAVPATEALLALLCRRGCTRQAKAARAAVAMAGAVPWLRSSREWTAFRPHLAWCDGSKLCLFRHNLVVLDLTKEGTRSPKLVADGQVVVHLFVPGRGVELLVEPKLPNNL